MTHALDSAHLESTSDSWTSIVQFYYLTAVARFRSWPSPNWPKCKLFLIKKNKNSIYSNCRIIICRYISNINTGLGNMLDSEDKKLSGCCGISDWPECGLTGVNCTRFRIRSPWQLILLHSYQFMKYLWFSKNQINCVKTLWKSLFHF